MGTTTTSCRCRQGFDLVTISVLILFLLVVGIHGGDDDDDYDSDDTGAGLIDGGTIVQEGRYTYHMSIKFEGLHACGGVLVAKKWLLTIQACARRREGRENQVTVVMGICLEGEELKISRIVLEEGGDLALMELEEETSEQVVELNRKSKVKPGTKLTLVGFGRSSANDAFSQKLQEIGGLEVKNKKSCEVPPNLRPRVLCVGDDSRACFGDEGAPLILPDPSNPNPASDKLVALAIFPSGADECGSDKPGVFVNVAKSMEWVDSVIN